MGEYAGFCGTITAAAGFFSGKETGTGPAFWRAMKRIPGGGYFPKSPQMSETFRKFIHFSETRPLTGCGRVLE